jgi:hypothetical protein
MNTDELTPEEQALLDEVDAMIEARNAQWRQFREAVVNILFLMFEPLVARLARWLRRIGME